MEGNAGEPFNNYDAVMRAIQIATHPMGLHFSKNKVTVSTVGLVPQLRRFCRSGVPAQLAVSLHAPNDDLRSTIVPVNRTHSLRLLTECLRCDPTTTAEHWARRAVLESMVGVVRHQARGMHRMALTVLAMERLTMSNVCCVRVSVHCWRPDLFSGRPTGQEMADAWLLPVLAGCGEADFRMSADCMPRAACLSCDKKRLCFLNFTV